MPAFSLDQQEEMRVWEMGYAAAETAGYLRRKKGRDGRGANPLGATAFVAGYMGGAFLDKLPCWVENSFEPEVLAWIRQGSTYESRKSVQTNGATSELGRSWYLREKRMELVIKGKTISVEKIRKACKDHLLKQEWGQGSVVQRFLVNSGTGKLINIKHHEKPQSEEYQDAKKQLDEATERQKARTPGDRHAGRMKAFYVEPTDLGTDWNKPWEKDKEAAQHFIEDALNDYAVQRNSVWVLEILKGNDPELAQAVEDWTERPDLPLCPSLY
jgi:hypothetical protein